MKKIVVATVIMLSATGCGWMFGGENKGGMVVEYKKYELVCFEQGILSQRVMSCWGIEDAPAGIKKYLEK